VPTETAPAPTPGTAVGPTASAQADSATGISGVKTVINHIHANDTTSGPSATWDLNKDLIVDVSTGAKSTVVNGVMTLDTDEGTAHLIQNPDGTVDADFVSIRGYLGTPPLSVFSQDSNGATAQAALNFTITAATGAVVANATAHDDVAVSLDGGPATNSNILANDFLSTPDGHWNTDSFVAIDRDNADNRATMVDGKATLVTAEGTSTFTVVGEDAISYSGVVDADPSVAYFIQDSNGASAQANINVSFENSIVTPAPEVPAETVPVVDAPVTDAPVAETPVDAPVTTPEAPVAETPVDAPVTAPEAPVTTPEAPVADAPVVSSNVPVATKCVPYANTAYVAPNAKDNLAENAAQEGGFSLGDILFTMGGALTAFALALKASAFVNNRKTAKQ
jgi:hypothetical protein